MVRIFFLVVLLYASFTDRVNATEPSSATPDNSPLSLETPRLSPFLPDSSEKDTVTAVRFVTTDDFPPFSFLDAHGTLMGYNVELARLICTHIDLPCTIQVRPFPLLLDAVLANKADAIVAGVSNTAFLRRHLSFSRPYLVLPARFVAARQSPPEISAHGLAGLTIATPAHSRYGAFLRDFFPEANLLEVSDEAAALSAVQGGRARLAFVGAVAASFWLNGQQAAGCCALAGGAYSEAAYFGDGMTIAVARGNDTLRKAIDRSLNDLDREGLLADLSARFFPVPLN